MIHMDEATEARFVKIENQLSAFMEGLAASEAAAERRQAEWDKIWEKRQTDWEKRQERLERRVDRLARFGIAEVRRNRKDHQALFAALDKVGVRLAEITEKLDAMIRIEQDRQPPQQ